MNDRRVPFTAQHVWVDTKLARGDLAPGLLVEWRREGSKWLGLVIYVERIRGRDQDRWVARTEWVEAERITQERA